MTADIPNAYVQTDINQSGKKIIMKIRGELVDILVDVSPEIYSNYVVQKRSKCPLCSDVKSTLQHDGVIITVLQEVL